MLAGIAVIVFVVGLLAAAIVVSGGWIALKRESMKLLLIATSALAFIAVRLWINDRGGGDLLSVGLLLASLALFYQQYRRLSRLTPDARRRLGELRRRPAVWVLLGVLVAGSSSRRQ